MLCGPIGPDAIESDSVRIGGGALCRAQELPWHRTPQICAEGIKRRMCSTAGLVRSALLGKRSSGRGLIRSPGCGSRWRPAPVALEGVVCSWRIASWTPPDDLDDLLQFGRRKPCDDLVHAPRFEEADSRYHRLGHALRGGQQGRVIKHHSVGIGHGPKIAFQWVTRIMTRSWIGCHAGAGPSTALLAPGAWSVRPVALISTRSGLLPAAARRW